MLAANAILAQAKGQRHSNFEENKEYIGREESLKKISEDEQKRLKNFWRGIKVGIEANERLKLFNNTQERNLGNIEIQQNQNKYIIHPSHSYLKIIWDIYISLLLVFVTISVPYMIGFDVSPGEIEIIFDFCVTICFGLDIMANFSTAYFDSEKEKYVFDYRNIALRYMKFWFWVDLIATIPFDSIIGFAVGNEKDLRTVRMVRFLRLFRLLKVQQIFRKGRFEDLMNPALFNLLVVIVQIFFIAHIFACCWHYLTLPAAIGDFPNTWVNVGGYEGQSNESRYVASLYYIFVTMMTVGYGDIVPTNQLERIYSILTMLTGTIVFGGLIAQVTSLLQKQNPQHRKFKREYNEFKDLISALELPVTMKERAKDAYSYYLLKMGELESGILDNLARPLLIELMYELHQDTIQKIKLFRSSDRFFVVNLLRNSKPFNALPEEVLFEEGDIMNELVFIKNGVVRIAMNDGQKYVLVGCVLEGSFFGDAEYYKQTTSVAQYSALNHCHFLSISHAALHRVMRDNYEISTQFNGQLQRRYASLMQVIRSKTCVDIGNNTLLSKPYRARSATFYVPPSMSTSQYNYRVAKDRIWVDGVIESHSDSMQYISIEDSTVRQSKLRVIHKMPSPVNSSTGNEQNSGKSTGASLSMLEYFGLVSTPSDKMSAYQSKSLHIEIDNLVTETNHEALQQSYIILPTNSYKICWDLFIGLLIVFSVIVVPIQVGFFNNLYRDDNLLSYMIDIAFGLDMFLVFRTAVHSSKFDALIIDPWYIANNYFRTWFIVDFLSTIPFDSFINNQNDDDSSLSTIRLIKVFRLLRLLRVSRIIKLGSYLEMLEDYSGISPAIIQLSALILQLYFIGHLMACFWWGTTSLMTDNPWYMDTGGNSTTHQITGLVYGQLDGMKVGAQYLVTVYYIFTTIATIGYGDIHPIHPEEKLLSIFILVFGASIFGFMLANVSSVVHNLNQSETLRIEKLSELSCYLSEKDCSPDVAKRIMSYFRRQMKEKTVFDVDKMARRLPSMISTKILYSLHNKKISKIPIFEHIPNKTVALRIFRLLIPVYYEVGHYIMKEGQECKDIVFIVHGIAKVFKKQYNFVPVNRRRFLFQKTGRTKSVRPKKHFSFSELETNSVDLNEIKDPHEHQPDHHIDHFHDHIAEKIVENSAPSISPKLIAPGSFYHQYTDLDALSEVVSNNSNEPMKRFEVNENSSGGRITPAQQDTSSHHSKTPPQSSKSADLEKKVTAIKYNTVPIAKSAADWANESKDLYDDPIITVSDRITDLIGHSPTSEQAIEANSRTAILTKHNLLKRSKQQSEHASRRMVESIPPLRRQNSVDSQDSTSSLTNIFHLTRGQNSNRVEDPLDAFHKPFAFFKKKDFETVGYDYLGDLGVGDFIGHMTLIDEGSHFPRANVRTAEACTVFTLSGTEIAKLLREEPSIGIILQSALTKAIALQSSITAKFFIQRKRAMFLKDIRNKHFEFKRNATIRRIANATKRGSFTSHTVDDKKPQAPPERPNAVLHNFALATGSFRSAGSDQLDDTIHGEDIITARRFHTAPVRSNSNYGNSSPIKSVRNAAANAASLLNYQTTSPREHHHHNTKVSQLLSGDKIWYDSDEDNQKVNLSKKPEKVHQPTPIIGKMLHNKETKIQSDSETTRRDQHSHPMRMMSSSETVSDKLIHAQRSDVSSQKVNEIEVELSVIYSANNEHGTVSSPTLTSEGSEVAKNVPKENRIHSTRPPFLRSIPRPSSLTSTLRQTFARSVQLFSSRGHEVTKKKFRRRSLSLDHIDLHDIMVRRQIYASSSTGSVTPPPSTAIPTRGTLAQYRRRSVNNSTTAATGLPTNHVMRRRQSYPSLDTIHWKKSHITDHLL